MPIGSLSGMQRTVLRERDANVMCGYSSERSALLVVESRAGKRTFFDVTQETGLRHLLRSGIDIVTISQWLGHASVTTTNWYATVDLEMKRKAIERARPIDHATTGLALWRSDASILTWLETL
jgi:integrase/recombinase XerD